MRWAGGGRMDGCGRPREYQVRRGRLLAASRQDVESVTRGDVCAASGARCTTGIQRAVCNNIWLLVYVPPISFDVLPSRIRQTRLMVTKSHVTDTCQFIDTPITRIIPRGCNPYIFKISSSRLHCLYGLFKTTRVVSIVVKLYHPSLT